MDTVRILHLADIDLLPWRDLDVDLVLIVLAYTARKPMVRAHQSGREESLFHPGANDVDNTIIYGVNHQTLTAQHKVVSNAALAPPTASCQLLRPSMMLLALNLGPSPPFTPSMNDQQGDWHLTTPILPSIRMRCQSFHYSPDTKLHKGKEYSRNFPTNLKLFRCSADSQRHCDGFERHRLIQNVKVNDVNQTIVNASQCTLRGIVDYTEAPLVSIDFNHDPHSAIVDGTQTRVSNGHLVKMLVWCDNEWGFANRMLDTALWQCRPSSSRPSMQI